MSSLPGSALLVAIRRAGGICPSWAEELTGERAHVANRRLPGLFRKGGMSGDALREWLQEAGYIAEHDAVRADREDTGGAIELALERIRAAFAGEHVLTVWDELDDPRTAPPDTLEVFHLEDYDEADLERLAIQAESSCIEEHASALRDRDTCILTAPAGTAPARVLTPQPTVQPSLWKPLETARILRAQAKAERQKGSSLMTRKNLNSAVMDRALKSWTPGADMNAHAVRYQVSPSGLYRALVRAGLWQKREKVAPTPPPQNS